jgi:hypothetical protein
MGWDKIHDLLICRFWTESRAGQGQEVSPEEVSMSESPTFTNSRRPLLNWTERLEFDLCPQLHDALGRNLEVIRRADGIAPHEGV